MQSQYTPITPTKQCSKCKEWLPATSEYFHRWSRTKDGLRSKCRKCRSIRPGGFIAPAQSDYIRCHSCLEEFPATIEFFALSRTSKSGFQVKCKRCCKEWRAANPEKTRESRQKFYATHPGCRTEYSRTYRKKNPGKSAKDARKRYADDPEKARKYRRKTYAKNPQAGVRASRKYAIAHPEKMRAVEQRRQARKRSLPDSFTPANWDHAISYWQGCCAYCGGRQGLFRDTLLCMEHFIPLSSPDCTGTIPENILPGCTSCNNSKKDKPPETWLISKFGARRATAILKRIQTYFDSLSTG